MWKEVTNQIAFHLVQWRKLSKNYLKKILKIISWLGSRDAILIKYICTAQTRRKHASVKLNLREWLYNYNCLSKYLKHLRIPLLIKCYILYSVCIWHMGENFTETSLGFSFPEIALAYFSEGSCCLLSFQECHIFMYQLSTLDKRELLRPFPFHLAMFLSF